MGSSLEGLAFSSGEAARAVGISYRRLDYWARIGLVTPSVLDGAGKGTRRSYSFRDLLVLRVADLLRVVGSSDFIIQAVARAIRGIPAAADSLGLYEVHLENGSLWARSMRWAGGSGEILTVPVSRALTMTIDLGRVLEDWRNRPGDEGPGVLL